MGNCQIESGDSEDNQHLPSRPVQLLDRSEGTQGMTRASAGLHTDRGLHLSVTLTHLYHVNIVLPTTSRVIFL
jgi:hypothetical protein